MALLASSFAPVGGDIGHGNVGPCGQINVPAVFVIFVNGGGRRLHRGFRREHDGGEVRPRLFAPVNVGSAIKLGEAATQVHPQRRDFERRFRLRLDIANRPPIDH